MSNQETVYETCLQAGFTKTLSQLVTAQSQHESANYTSNIFINCSNAFGYDATDNPCSYNPVYESYDSLVDSTKEIIGWLRRREADGSFPDLTTITTPQQYAQLLYNAGYYTDTVENYTNGLLAYFDPTLGTSEDFIFAAITIAIVLILIFIKKK